jgi:hypothetical protein
MNLKDEKHIILPVWALSLLAPIFITLMIALVNNLTSQAVVKEKVSDIEKRLNHIEYLLDNHVQLKSVANDKK